MSDMSEPTESMFTDMNVPKRLRNVLKDIAHGEPSKTPVADRLLGLETLVRRIEEQELVK